MPRSEGGFMLIEVLVSAMLVALIGVGVFTGLAGANHATVNERRNAQATVIAQQDEERLRGLPVEELTQIGNTTHNVAENGMCLEGSTGAWKYWSGAATFSCEALTAPLKGTTYTGAVFTVESSAQFVTASKETLTCETEKGTADYLETSSSVTWPSIGTHAPISQSSLVAVPRSGTLLVKITNRKAEAVAGAKVEVFDPKTAGTVTAEQTTPTSGCVIFGDLAEGEAKVVASKGNWLTKNGKTAAEQPSTTITKTKLAEVSLLLQEPGGIKAEFVNSSNEHVESSTFVASQNEMGSPSFDVGGEVNGPAATATLENLFPFITPPSTPNPYTVYAGDCEANNPATIVSGATARSVQVEPGTPSPAKVEVAPIKVKVYEGGTGTTPLLSSTSAAIINTECNGAKTNNGKTVEYKHEVKIASGGLESKYEYQPYAKKLEFCVVGKVIVSGTTNYYESKTKFENITKTGFTIPAINLGSSSTPKVSSTTKC
jgi:type II secretory pathway pseudopilin PulG